MLSVINFHFIFLSPLVWSVCKRNQHNKSKTVLWFNFGTIIWSDQENKDPSGIFISYFQGPFLLKVVAENRSRGHAHASDN